MDQQAPAFAYVAEDMRRALLSQNRRDGPWEEAEDMGNLLGPAVEAEGILQAPVERTGTRRTRLDYQGH
jgi:hypothetical protein